MKVHYSFRFYPTEDQKHLLSRVFGACRFVYNWALRARTDAYYKEGIRIGYHESSSMLTALKKTKEHEWLNEISSVPTQQALRHLQKAFINFFEKRSKYPSFKKKTRDQSAEYTRSAFKWNAKDMVISLSGVGKLNVKWSREFFSIPSTAIVTKDTADRYFIALCLDEEKKLLPKTGRFVGVDLGITALATLSTGERIRNPRSLKRLEKCLARAQRNLSRKKKGSNRRLAQRLRVSKLHARITDARNDYLSKITTDLVRNFDVIAIEDLNVRGMVKNHSLANALLDSSLGEFRRMLEYKCKWYGRELRTVDRFYPSSKRCFNCGYVIESLPISARKWQCESCKSENDRDVNAAKNILAAGRAVIARGGTVRPKRLARGGTSQRSANQS